MHLGRKKHSPSVKGSRVLASSQFITSYIAHESLNGLWVLAETVGGKTPCKFRLKSWETTMLSPLKMQLNKTTTCISRGNFPLIQADQENKLVQYTGSIELTHRFMQHQRTQARGSILRVTERRQGKTARHPKNWLGRLLWLHESQIICTKMWRIGVFPLLLFFLKKSKTQSEQKAGKIAWLRENSSTTNIRRLEAN